MSGRTKRKGLRSKIITWSFYPTLIILATVALVTFTAYQKVTEDLVLAKDQELTRLSAAQLSTELKAYTDLLTEIATTANIRHADPARQSAALKHTSNRLVVFDGGVVILDTFGKLVASLPERPGELNRDWSDREYFREILRTPRPVYSNILPDGLGDAEVIVAAVPILGDQGEMMGVLAGMFRMGAREVSAFYGGIVKQRIGENGDTYLVDKRGRVVYHNKFDQFGENLSGQSVVDLVISGGAGALRTNNANGDRIVAAYAPIPGTPWGLVHEERWDALTKVSQGYQQFLILLLILGVLIPVVVVTIGIRRIMKPIENLITAAKEIAQGNFNQAIPAQTGDEIEELATQFNLMSSQLQASYEQLEKRVADRTKELTTLYQADEELLAHLQLDQLLQALVDMAVDILKADKSSVMVWDDKQEKLVVGAARGFSEATIERMSFTKEMGVIGRVMATGEPAVVEDTHNYPEVALHITEPEGIRALIHVPIKLKSQVFGIFNFNYLAPRVFSDEERRLFIALAQRAALAIENARLYEQAQYAATIEERQRLARDLHDAVTQTLFSSSLIAEVLPRIWERNPEEGRRRLDELRQLTRGALAEMRTLLMELRPSALLEVDLGDLLRQLAEAFTGRSRVNVQIEVFGSVEILPDVKVSLYRIAQEALNNVAKHAGANQVTVTLRNQPGVVELSIADNGRGFEVEGISSNHLGLRIMRERASEIGANLVVESQPGAGTKVIASWNPG